jgi:DNA repair protein RadC
MLKLSLAIWLSLIFFNQARRQLMHVRQPQHLRLNHRFKLPSYIKDHRKRLRERFINGGADAVPDYELLELVLFRAIPRHDVKPLARKLLETFGDFNGVLSATRAQLLDIEGVGASIAVELKIIEAAAHRLSRAKVIGKHVLSSW